MGFQILGYFGIRVEICWDQNFNICLFFLFLPIYFLIVVHSPREKLSNIRVLLVRSNVDVVQLSAYLYTSSQSVVLQVLPLVLVLQCDNIADLSLGSSSLGGLDSEAAPYAEENTADVALLRFYFPISSIAVFITIL